MGVRFAAELYDRIADDAEANCRSIGSQLEFIVRQHYSLPRKAASSVPQPTDDGMCVCPPEMMPHAARTPVYEMPRRRKPA
ncbi:TA system antitoxin ParD family protein [Methylobacterium sp. BE186]|uniref:TA system antitoxin ParD family protein n=1 Tax=Methylobacterium sp. BE186 TaxID=2817715 RepID=UPI003862073E